MINHNVSAIKDKRISKTRCLAESWVFEIRPEGRGGESERTVIAVSVDIEVF